MKDKSIVTTEDFIQENGMTFYYNVGLIAFESTIVDLKRVVAIQMTVNGNTLFTFDGANTLSAYMPFQTVFDFWKKFLAFQACK